MIISSLFSKTFNLLKYNLVLVQPLLLFMLLLGFIMAPIATAGQVNIAFIIMIASIIGLFGAFSAGWLSMFHKTVELADKPFTKEEKAINSIKLFKEFFPGVGKYFSKVVIGFVIFWLLFLIFMNLVGIAGEIFIGIPDTITPQEISASFMSEEKTMQLMSKISDSDKMKWYLLTVGAICFYLYSTMFWIQAIVVDNKNPLSAYWESMKTVIKNPFVTLTIFLSYLGSLIAISTLSAMYPSNIILQFIGLILVVLVVVYFTMMMFLYFEQFRKNNNDSRADSIWQD